MKVKSVQGKEPEHNTMSAREAGFHFHEQHGCLLINAKLFISLRLAADCQVLRKMLNASGLDGVRTITISYFE